jgi:glycosyltransferase involved in cell wall biosynthesis
MPMPGDEVAGGDGDRDDPQREALRAEALHWRELAERRDAALRSLARRPLVRVAVGIDRRTGPLQRGLASWRGRRKGAAGQALLAVTSLPARWTRRQRATALHGQIAGLPPSAGEPPVSVVVLAGPNGVRRPSGTGSFPRVIAVGGLGSAPDPGADVVVRADGLGRIAALARGAQAATTEVLCFAPDQLEPLGSGWLAALSSALGEGVVAATPTLVHPDRRGRHTTEHDQRVRSEGFDLSVDAAGVPVALARRAGLGVDVGRAPLAVDIAPLPGLVVDREAYLAAGGLQDVGDDDDAAAADLCMRLWRLGGRVVHVPASVVVDGRPVMSRRALRQPIDAHGAGWRSFIDRQGSAAARRAGAGSGAPRRWVITTAVPSARLAPRWGDWHLAEALARALRALGQDVLVQTHDQADSLVARSRDVHLVLHGLGTVRRTAGQHHIVWVVSHPETFDVEECDAADLVVVASPRFAEHLRARSRTPIEVLLQATDPQRFRPRPPVGEHQHPVTIVAKTREVLRPVVADALAAGVRPAIYGSGWEHLVDPTLVVADHIDNEELAVVYASAGVVLNDHWDTMAGWGFVSNRIFDVLACGTPIISDDVAEIRELFGDVVPTYRTSDELGELVRDALDDPAAARRRAEEGRLIVLEHHTFDHRARQLLDLVEQHHLGDPDSLVPW